MKRYELIMNDMYPDPEGEWVRADVAQALYDALQELAKEADVWAKVVPAYQNSKPLIDAHKAMALADKNGEE